MGGQWRMVSIPSKRTPDRELDLDFVLMTSGPGPLGKGVEEEILKAGCPKNPSSTFHQRAPRFALNAAIAAIEINKLHIELSLRSKRSKGISRILAGARPCFRNRQVAGSILVGWPDFIEIGGALGVVGCLFGHPGSRMLGSFASSPKTERR